MFQKTNFEYYENYDVFEIHIVPFQIQDVISTSIWIKMQLKMNEKVVHELVDTKTSYLDYSSSDAVIKDVRYMIRIFKRIHLPTKEIRIYIHNLPAYLFLTKQIPASSITLKNWIGLFYKDLKKYKLPVYVYLGDKKTKLEYENFIKTENSLEKYTFPSEKMLGIEDMEFILKQKGKREEWKKNITNSMKYAEELLKI